MPVTCTDNRNGKLIRWDLDGAGLLSEAFIAQFTREAEEIDDATENVVLLFNIEGRGSRPPSGAWPGDVDTHALGRWERALRDLERANAGIVSFAHGACSPLALDILLISDYRIASSDLTMQLPLHDDHPWPGMQLYRMNRQIGGVLTRRLALSRKELSMPLALEIGLVDEAASGGADGIESLVDELASEPLRYNAGLCRRLIEDGSFSQFDDALGLHLAACDRILRKS